MGDFLELFAVDSVQVLKFFYDYLTQESARHDVFSRVETLYVAGVLAHYAQTSREGRVQVPPASLTNVFDTFVAPRGLLFGQESDPGILEEAGSQTLLLAGFFRDQMRLRHNVRWYDRIGKGFFGRAGLNSPNGAKREVLLAVSEHFPLWTRASRNASREMRYNRYLLALGSPST